jgi:hypothetical protein
MLIQGVSGGSPRWQRAEGANDPPLPLNSFFVAPNVWTKFSIRHPGVSYLEFLSYHAKCYQLRNEAARRFFAEFSKDPRVERPFLESAPPDGRPSVI